MPTIANPHSLAELAALSTLVHKILGWLLLLITVALLRPLLSDKRPAVYWGSEGAEESRLRGYRICDYAWALSLAALGEQVPIPAEVTARDSLIASFMARGK